MDPRRNPYAPGAGIKPPEFAGREGLIEAADIAFDRVLNGLYAKDMILLGLRGVGKTVLLNHLHTLAKAKGFETVRFEVADAEGGHLARELVPALGVILRRLDRAHAVGEALKAAGLALRNFAAVFRIKYEGISVGAEPGGRAAAPADLEHELPELLARVAEAARAGGTALGLFIDEIQYLTKPELSALARSCHQAAQDDLPLMLVGTGLPQMAALAGEAKSYAERLFDYPELGALDPEAARQVLAEPAARFGAAFTAEALERILRETQCFPYFLQTWGKFAWDQAPESPITERDVKDARPDIDLHLDRNFFRVRFDRCSPAEWRYLRAMAELGPGPHRTGDIAAALGTKSAAVAPIRRSLISLGMIYSQRHGETAFTVPLFDAFMKRAIPELEPHQPRRRGA